jgi:hypothetical protein
VIFTKHVAPLGVRDKQEVSDSPSSTLRNVVFTHHF